jgi:hypothetical protein
MSNPAPSSHPRREPQPVNPYAASQVPEPQSLKENNRPPAEASERKFQARMSWNDRRKFLRSVGPTRVTAVCATLIWLKSIYELIRSWNGYVTMETLGYWVNVVMFGLALVVLAQGLIALYGCLLDWRYADRLREVAGGSTRSMADWSQLHLRTAWLFAVVIVLELLNQSVQWIVDQILAQRLFAA